MFKRVAAVAALVLAAVVTPAVAATADAGPQVLSSTEVSLSVLDDLWCGLLDVTVSTFTVIDL